MRDDCRLVKDDLAAIVDGDPAALARHAAHLAGCDDCRDARHDAARIGAAIARAGDDHAPRVDLEARLLAMIDAEAAATAGTRDAGATIVAKTGAAIADAPPTQTRAAAATSDRPARRVSRRTIRGRQKQMPVHFPPPSLEGA